MIADLKNTEFGHKVHRFLRGPGLEIVTRITQIEFVQISHIYPRHLRHNARQKEILSNFESEQK